MSEEEKTKVKIFYTGYVVDIAKRSSRVCAAMHRVQTQFDFQKWDGRLESLPMDEPVLVDVNTIRVLSSDQTVSLEELITFCEKHGHLLFDGDAYFRGRDTVSDLSLIERAVRNFTERVRMVPQISLART